MRPNIVKKEMFQAQNHCYYLETNKERIEGIKIRLYNQISNPTRTLDGTESTAQNSNACHNTHEDQGDKLLHKNRKLNKHPRLTV